MSLDLSYHRLCRERPGLGLFKGSGPHEVSSQFELMMTSNNMDPICLFACFIHQAIAACDVLLSLKTKTMHSQINFIISSFNANFHFWELSINSNIVVEHSNKHFILQYSQKIISYIP